MVRKKTDEKPKYDILNVDGTKYRTHSIKKYDQRHKWEPENPDKVLAMIPGTIVKMMVKEGQKVAEGKCLYVLEAMKMKNRFLAEQTGYIAKIHVQEGDVIAKKHLIMEYGDPPPAPPSKSRLSRARSKK